MELARAKVAFWNQVSNAAKRKIEFRLTFEQWMEWWGADLDRRGSKPNDLQMCRLKDEGVYELGNIYKATAKENAKTAGNSRRNRASESKRKAHQAYLDSLMWAASKESKDERFSEEEIELLRTTGAIRQITAISPAFCIDKNR